MKLEKYDPNKTSKASKISYTVFAVLMAPYTLLLSLLFIQFIWNGRFPLAKGSGKLKSYKDLEERK